MKPKRWRTKYENELARELWKAGFIVCRCPASGGSKRSYPCLDLFAWCPRTGILYAIEVKSSSRCNDEKCLTQMLTQQEKEKMEKLRERGTIVLVALHSKGKWLWFVVRDGELVRENPLVFC